MIELTPQITVSERVPLPEASSRQPPPASFDALFRAASKLTSAPSRLADDATSRETPPGESSLARGRVGSERPEATPPGKGPGSPTTPDPPPVETPVLSPDEQLGFFRSADLEGPVRFKAVPEWAKWPLGNFRQAPEEFGGESWRLSPFTGPEPWASLNRPFERPAEILPEGFEALFGTRPQFKDYDHYMDFKTAELEWEGRLERFIGVGLPEGIDAEALAASTQVMLEWGLGEPQFYEDSYGWHAKFPDSANPRFEISPTTLLMAPHLTVSRYQVGLIQLGIVPDRLHPFVPPSILSKLEGTVVT